MYMYHASILLGGKMVESNNLLVRDDQLTTETSHSHIQSMIHRFLADI